MKGKNSAKAILLLVLTIGSIAAAIWAVHYSKVRNAEIKARREHEQETVSNAYKVIEKQYFPLEGKATAINVINTRRIKILFLDGTFEENIAQGDIFYNYDLHYDDDNTFTLTASLDTAGSTHKDDRNFQCILTIDGEDATLSELVTQDDYPAFTTSEMLKGGAKNALEERETEFFYESWNYVLEQSTSTRQKTNQPSSSSSSARSSNSNSNNSSSKRNTKTYSDYGEIDPYDHDIEQYYLDYQDEFEDEDDAADDFLDNPEYWDDY